MFISRNVKSLIHTFIREICLSKPQEDICILLYEGSTPSDQSTGSHHYLQPSLWGHLLPTEQSACTTARIILASRGLHHSVPKTGQIKASAPLLFSQAPTDWLHHLFWRGLNFTPDLNPNSRELLDYKFIPRLSRFLSTVSLGQTQRKTACCLI